jgi:hypothetical protein
MSDGVKDSNLPTIGQILEDPAASLWLKSALRSALSRDPVDAANEADLMAQVLEFRCRTILKNPTPV